MTDPVKAKLIELVPDILETVYCGSPCNCRQGSKREREITLADVLRAIQTQLTKYDDVKIYVGKDSTVRW